ncbi:YgaP family membrane protein [Metabacillus sp. JX24]|uniref:YgaP family membrane protein n=1 Tax=Metabacillus sp. JX24 TaxID=3240759 RepID=UPI003510A310
MKPNIGIVNGLIRITIGLFLLSWASAKYSKKPWKESALLVMLLGAMKVGEGILRFCPLTFMYQEYKKEDLEFGDKTYNPS